MDTFWLSTLLQDPGEHHGALLLRHLLGSIVHRLPTLIRTLAHALGSGRQVPLVRICVSEEPRLDLGLSANGRQKPKDCSTAKT